MNARQNPAPKTSTRHAATKLVMALAAVLAASACAPGSLYTTSVYEPAVAGSEESELCRSHDETVCEYTLTQSEIDQAMDDYDQARRARAKQKARKGFKRFLDRNRGNYEPYPAAWDR